MSTFSADWTTIAAMLQCHAERFGSRPAILGEGGLQLSHQEMHAPTATLSLELPLSLRFRLPTRALLARGWMNCSLLGKSICSRPKKSCDTKTDMPLSRKFTREAAAGAEAGTPASAWDADATLKSCNKTVFQDLQPSEEAGR
jgi:hypothetical protein